MRREPSLTFRGALRILGRAETPLLDKLDALLGGLILAAGAGAAIATVGGPALAGAAALAPIWQWVDQKNEAGGILRRLVAHASSKINMASGLERRQLVAAAHSTIVVAAYFDVFHDEVKAAGFGRFRLGERQMAEVATSTQRKHRQKLIDWLYSAELPAPSATRGFEENAIRVGRWIEQLDNRTKEFLDSHFVPGLPEDVFTTTATLAMERYRSYYVDLAANVREFQLWAELAEHAATRNLVTSSFQHIEQILLSLNPSDPGIHSSAVALFRANRGRMNDPVVSSAIPWLHSTVGFPTVAELFVSPGFRITEFSSSTRVSDDRWWLDLPLQNSLGERLAAHVLSTDATRAPLLLLGHPGAGKSMLTKVLAAYLPGADYITVRVPLRSVSAHALVLDQIQEGLDRATHKRVSWAQLADETADRLRVVLLDGLDELLQAANLDRTGYLQEIMRFQQLEADQDRPVAVVVTSRTVVADRVDIPVGAAVIKLAEFNDDQITEWLSRWNNANTDPTGGAARVRQLTTGEALRHPHLASQPLLLMLLALYVSSPDAVELLADSSMAVLYNHLFTGFAGRETTKNAGRAESTGADSSKIETAIDRLSVAAFAMFNRGRHQIGEAELGKDLDALSMSNSAARPEVAGQRLLAEFFFVHAAEATLIPGGPTERSYEFLHATFGEYLVARKILEVLRDIADVAFGGRRGRREPDDALLHTLLCRQALAGQRPIVEFAGQLFQTLPEAERSDLVEVVDDLIRRWRFRPPSEKYEQYQPTANDRVRQLAAYSANLVVLRLAFESSSCLRLSSLSPDGTLESWDAMATLWRAGLDPDAWLSMLGAITFDRRRLLIVAEPPRHGRMLAEYDHARLAGRERAAEQIGMGMAIVDGIQEVFAEDDWLYMMQSWTIPALSLRIPQAMAFSLPPDGTSTGQTQAIVQSLERLLRWRSADLSLDSASQVVKLLLGMTASPDPKALAVVICQHPRLLLYLPELADATLYRPAEATVLMMHATRPGVGEDERPQFESLYQELCVAADYYPAQERFSARSEQFILKLFQQLTSADQNHGDAVNAEVIVD
ncbi:AAA family ATPase [Micromonospora sp. STR1_7]|uniref:AAA family ATPase n=1 Tax=Micromonospora parastrephiae TaxID=2806101 RepID=A0ABS1XTC1_9ACTN|nr:AAA family ATPase [Micromonospora parastrephiae]MBM0232496.1 AAA family ATPase [Micromonospora parastrephiae]